jgi:hypothetical protein
MKKYISITFVFFVLSACKKDSDILKTLSYPKDYTVVRSIVGTFASRVDNPYYSYLTNTDYNIYFFSASSIAADLSGHTTLANALVYPSSTNTDEQATREFQIEEVNFTYQNSAVGFAPLGGNTSNEQLIGLSQNLMSYYGKDVNFTSKKNGKEVLNQKIYIPQVIRLNNIYGPLNGPVRIAGSVNLSWNQDSKNTNGVIIYATATDTVSKKAIENIAFAQDNGTYMVNHELLKNIPAGVPFTIQIIRGNLLIANDKLGKSCKLFGYTSSGHLFIL